MMELTMQGLAGIVRVDIDEDDDDLLFATSLDLPGLFVAAADIEALRAEIPKVIRALYQAEHGHDVTVVRAATLAAPRRFASGGSWVTLTKDVLPEAIMA